MWIKRRDSLFVEQELSHIFNTFHNRFLVGVFKKHLGIENNALNENSLPHLVKGRLVLLGPSDDAVDPEADELIGSALIQIGFALQFWTDCRTQSHAQDASTDSKENCGGKNAETNKA